MTNSDVHRRRHTHTRVCCHNAITLHTITQQMARISHRGTLYGILFVLLRVRCTYRMMLSRYAISTRVSLRRVDTVLTASHFCRNLTHFSRSSYEIRS